MWLELKVSRDMTDKDQVILCIKNTRKFKFYFQNNEVPVKCFKPKNNKEFPSSCACVHAYMSGFKISFNYHPVHVTCKYGIAKIPW